MEPEPAVQPMAEEGEPDADARSVADEGEPGEGPIEGCPEWCRYLDGDGDAYYFHTLTEETQWEMPDEVAVVLRARREARQEAPAGSPAPTSLRGLRTHSWTEDLGVRSQDLAASVEEMTDRELVSTLEAQGLREEDEEDEEAAVASSGSGPVRTLSAEEQAQRTCSRKERLRQLFSESLAPVIESDAENQSSPEKPSEHNIAQASPEKPSAAPHVEGCRPKSPVAATQPTEAKGAAAVSAAVFEADETRSAGVKLRPPPALPPPPGSPLESRSRVVSQAAPPVSDDSSDEDDFARRRKPQRLDQQAGCPQHYDRCGKPRCLALTSPADP